MISMTKAPVRLTSLFAFIFFFSGFASLIYQVVWQRILTLHYGVGAISISLIVSIYMFGLGIGALFGGFLAERVKGKITLYFFVELLIGLFGLISLPFLKLLGQSTAGSSHLLSSLYMFSFLGIPTFLMGITLPLLTKIFNRLAQHFLYSLSSLYFINTLGASIGAVFASYGVISFFGLDTGIYFAMAINFILAALIFLARFFPVNQQERVFVRNPQAEKNFTLGQIVYPLVFITGFLAIGYEIVWFRVVGVLVKASPYAFSSILSVYLLGIALGSLGMKKYLRRQKMIDKRSLFFLLQLIIGLYVMVIFIGYLYLTKYTPLASLTQTSFSSSLHPTFAIPSFLSVGTFLKDFYLLVDVFFWPMMFVFVPTLFMGASFPLVSSLALKHKNKEGKTVGIVYFFTITGNVLGGILTGFLLLPYFGTEITLIAFSSVGILLGFFVTRIAGKPFSFVAKMGVILVLVIVNILFFPKRGRLYEAMHTSPGGEFRTYQEEGIDGVVVTYKHKERVANYINGLHHGGRPVSHYYAKTIEAVSFTPELENVLIIGYGTGSFAEAILKMQEVRKLTVVEISDTLIKNLKKIHFFKRMLANKRVDLTIDDGRRFLLRTQKRFDLMMMDPLRLTTSYSNNLYSRQFLELAGQHLSEKGIIMLYLGETKDWVLPKTVLSAFSQVRMYKIHGLESFFCLASRTPFHKDIDRERYLLSRFSAQERKGIIRNHAEYLGDQAYIKEAAAHFPINKDWRPVCEYYLGLRIKQKFF